MSEPAEVETLNFAPEFGMSFDENQQGAVDVLMLPFLAAESDGEVEVCLADLFQTHLDPLIADKFRIKFRTEKQRDERDDLQSEVRQRLLEKFAALKSQPSAARRLDNLPNFTAGVVRHVWLDYLNRKRPEWARLKNRIVYALDVGNDFVRLPNSAGALRAGAKTPTNRAENEITAHVRALGFNVAAERLPELLGKILTAADGAVEIKRLVGIVFELWNADLRPLQINVSNKILDELNSNHDGNSTDRHSTTLGALWREIKALQPNQRRALLLNLRDEQGYEVVGLFVQTNTASLREIAAALGFAEEKFAQIYNRLPLSDEEIAVLLNLELWQIGNLRSAARRRLKRKV